MWLKKPKLTQEQLDAIKRIQEGNPSLMPITYGLFSDGSISLHLIWKNDKLYWYTQTLDLKGEIISDGGPYSIELLKSRRTDL